MFRFLVSVAVLLSLFTKRLRRFFRRFRRFFRLFRRFFRLPRRFFRLRVFPVFSLNDFDAFFVSLGAFFAFSFRLSGGLIPVLSPRKSRGYREKTGRLYSVGYNEGR